MEREVGSSRLIGAGQDIALEGAGLAGMALPDREATRVKPEEDEGEAKAGWRKAPQPGKPAPREVHCP